MGTLIGFFRNIGMTKAIAALVLCSIVVSIAIVSTSIYLNLYSRSMSGSMERQVSNMAVAATILELRISGKTFLNEDGTIKSFQVWNKPNFFNNEHVDAVSQVTKEETSVYVLNKDGTTLESKSSSIKNSDGTPAMDMVLDPGTAPYEAVMGGGSWSGEIKIAGITYLGALQAIIKQDGSVLGAIFVGTPRTQIEAAAGEVVSLILVVGGIVTAAMGLVGLFVSRLITRPVPKLAKAMQIIAEGHYETVVPFAGRRNEIGGMAAAVEVFRQNGLRVAHMTETEAARIISDQQARQEMMSRLQQAFGRVVDAATAGDLTQRVDATFSDPELNSLADGVNDLVSGFDHGLTEIGRVVAALSDADLTQRMEGDFRGAFQELQSDINAMAGRLTDIASQLRDTSGTLKVATGEILSGANDLSERTTRQAATIEETSATIEQLASTVMQNAQRAREASGNAAQVTRTAEEGGAVMSEATHAMERITGSSTKISGIIGMIDDIAFQTNLLALNASVEAARAGDAGKGFAVVAVEVRRLAQSAAQASAEVKVLIEQSAGEVRSGSKLVVEAGSKLAQMLVAVRGNGNLLDAIARQSAEQASAIDEVHAAVRTMDEVTQHNAALVEQTNAAIEQTETQANELDRIVDIFKIDTNVPTASQKAPPRPYVRPAAVRHLAQGNAALDTWK